MTKNPTHHAQTKHIDVQHHFVRKRAEKGEVRFEYCPMEHVVANVLAKTLSKERHHYWKQFEIKQKMKHSRFMKWNNCIN